MKFFSFDSAHIIGKLIAANNGINCDVSPGSTEASVLELDTSPLDKYQTVNEIGEEVCESIVSWENSRRSKDSGFFCGFDQIGPMQRAPVHTRSWSVNLRPSGIDESRT